MSKNESFEPQVNIDFVEESLILKNENTSRQSLNTKNIPLPNEMPKPIKFENLPSNISRSSVIESLIDQNDDLMARLSVTLRRNSILEDSIFNFEDTLKQLENRNQNLSDQILIYKQKDQRVANFKDSYDHQIKELKEQINFLERQYAEFYSHSQEKQNSLIDSLNKSQKSLKQLKKYKSKISPLAHTLRSNYKIDLAEKDKEINILSKKVIQLESTLVEANDKIRETVNYIQKQSKESESNQLAIVNEYEKKISILNQKTEELISENNYLKIKTSELDEIYNSKIEIENELLAIQRLTEETKLAHQLELNKLQEESLKYRKEAKVSEIENINLKNNLQNIESELIRKNDQIKSQSDQIESLQLLWSESNKENETLNEKLNSLQKLNQQLSINLNDQRKELQNAKQSHISSSFLSESIIVELKENIHQLIKENNQKPTDFDSQSNSEYQEFLDSALSKIDSLLKKF